MNFNDKKSEILFKTDIVQLIGENIRLYRRGANFIGLCPFHEEKTPSFTVSPDKQFFKCFGCGKSGNAITFVMEYNGLSFMEAMKLLAGKAGIPFEFEQQDSEKATKQSDLLAAMESATYFYTQNLFTKEGEKCLQYFKSRGFDESVIKSFQLGYSPDSFDKLHKYLSKKGISDEISQECGLLAKNEAGKVFDRFRNRAMFPIQDLFGRTIAFGARLLDEDKNQAKYINSPQTTLYDKSRVLYGLYQAKNAIMQQDKAIITEGYADVITMHTYGLKNTISSSGTSLTEQQLQLLSRYTKHLLLLFDGDDAGIKAAERALLIALQNNFEVEVLVLPDGNDPDSFLRKFGKVELIKLIDNQDNSFLNFLVNIHLKKGKLSSSAKNTAIKGILEVIAVVPEELHRSLLIDELASKLGFDNTKISVLQSDLKKIVGKKVTQNINENVEAIIKQHSNSSEFETECRNLIEKLTKSEYAFFRFILISSDNFELNIKNAKIDKYLISDVAKRLQVNIRNYQSYSDLFNELDNPEFNPHLRNIIRTLSLDNPKSSENWNKFNKNEINTDINYQFKLLTLNLEKDYIEHRLLRISQDIKNLTDETEKLTMMESYKMLTERKTELIKILSEI